MLRNLLICTDASEASDRMVECVKDLRRVGNRPFEQSRIVPPCEHLRVELLIEARRYPLFVTRRFAGGRCAASRGRCYG